MKMSLNNTRKMALGLGMGIIIVLSGCVGALDRQPFVELTSAAVYADFDNYKAVLAKLYAGLAVSGQQGPLGDPDIQGIDEGFSSYLRQLWKAQELTTDEAVIGWNDGSLPDYHDMDWTASNEFIGAMYSRIYYQVALCNELIRETASDKVEARGFTIQQAEELALYQAEARFLRAFSYFHAIDMFGRVPFVTEEDLPGAFLPEPIERADLFDYVVGELREIEPLLPGPRQNEYARVDQGAVWMLLARLFLNAEVYTGVNRYSDCLLECEKVINAGYSLNTSYETLFMADNHTSNEIIWPIAFDGLRTKTWGGMTFLTHAPVGGSMDPAEFGINNGWNGLRTTSVFWAKFDTSSTTGDSRSLFYYDGQDMEIDNIFNFRDGIPITKYKNVTSTGEVGSDPEGAHIDTDFPVFRLADAYLMYAEATLQGASGGNLNLALDYVNSLRNRAYGGASGEVTSIDLPFILDERGRELYWETTRRSDLIRFDLFTGDGYIWDWKGGIKEGQAVEDFRHIFPIPAADIVANPNLIQNIGY